jgi:mono/diheme cytochrome c family protein
MPDVSNYSMNTMKKTLYIILTLASVITFVASCTKDHKKPGLEYMPDMYRSPSYEVYSGNPNFKDSLTMQKPVEGTIPRGYHFFPYPATLEGYEAAGHDLKNPFEVNEANLAKGKQLFTIFCMHCHGETGQADGSLIATGKFPPPPNYTTGKSSRGGDMKDLTDGKIFHTITYGVNLMGSHASQLNPDERWKVVMYVRSIMSGASATAAAPSDSAATASAGTTRATK